MYGGWWTNKRMPDSDERHSTSDPLSKGPFHLAVGDANCGVSSLGFRKSFDDIFTGARKGERRFLLSTLVGDVLLIQGDVYAQVSYRTSI